MSFYNGGLTLNALYEERPERTVEIVERKGTGHPDTLADGLAEKLSRVYSTYTLEKYGAVLHHNFDKVGLMGGETKLEFGKYKITKPIRVLINGRASSVFGNDAIPVKDMLISAAKSFLSDRLLGIDPNKDLRIMYEVATGSSPGSVGNESNLRNRWFQPNSLDDLSERKSLNCNDTSLGTAFYKRSIVENCVWTIEQELNGNVFRSFHPWIGSDIKIMAVRTETTMKFTMAIPQLADYVNSTSEYITNKEFLYSYVMEKLQRLAEGYEIQLDINTRDRIGNSTDLYLTATGSSIEMGDEGFVGRGNRIGGLITPFRPYTMEGICGKNPVYHTGKMYSIAAWEISRKIYEENGLDVDVMIVGQSGHQLNRPWSIVFSGDVQTADKDNLLFASQLILDDFPGITTRILEGDYPLC